MSKEKATNFLQIPKETLLSNNFSKLSCNAKVTYLGLLTYWIRNPNQKDKQWKVKVTYRKLMETTKLSRSALYRAINELSEGNNNDKFILGIDNHFIYCTNEYELNPRWLQLTKAIPKAKK